MPQLLHGEHLRELLQRADAPWQRQEAIRQLLHARLTLGHRVHALQRGEPRVRHLQIRELMRDDTHYLAASGQGGVRDDAHEPHVAAAVDQPQLPARELRAQLACRFRKRRIIPRG